MLVLIVLVVIAGIALAVWQPWRGSADSATPQPSASRTTPAATPSTPPVTDAATDPAGEPTDAEPDPSASSTEPAIAACSTADITVQAVTDQESYGSGQLPQLSITMSNDSAVPCLINVGTATQRFEITSGSDTWWRSTDCQAESSDQVVQLAAGQTVSSVTPLPWDRTRSSVDTCGSSRPQAPSGYFHLSVSIGGIEAADTKMFQLR